MKILAPLALSIATVLIAAGCAQSEDPLEQAAMQASRVGTYVGETDRAHTTAGLEAGSRGVPPHVTGVSRYVPAKLAMPLETAPVVVVMLTRSRS